MSEQDWAEEMVDYLAREDPDGGFLFNPDDIAAALRQVREEDARVAEEWIGERDPIGIDIFTRKYGTADLPNAIRTRGGKP